MISDAQVEAAYRLLWDGGNLTRKDVREALEAAERAAWRPIEEAPKDEMFIYYWPRDGKRCIGLAYLARDGGWRDSEGDQHTRLEPTKWTPLPPPPEDAP